MLSSPMARSTDKSRRSRSNAPVGGIGVDADDEADELTELEAVLLYELDALELTVLLYELLAVVETEEL